MENSSVSHYRLGRLLGRGGMGEVYEAIDLDLDRRVALKFVAPELASDPQMTRRFEREAHAAAALNHPHIATLYAFERDGRRSFLSMELLSGLSVRDRIGAGLLPEGEALAIARDVAAALAYAHRRGIVHRDIKPENLMFDEHGVVKITDFGLAQVAQAAHLTTTHTTLGTAAYMAPEMLRGGAGPPSDVFSLGVVLFEMLTGALPFEADNAMAMMYAISNQAPRSLRALQPAVPEAVEQLVSRMMARDPGARPDARAVAEELAALTGAGAPGFRINARWLTVTALVLAIVLGGWILVLSAASARRHREAVLLNNQGIDSLASFKIDKARDLFEAALRKEPSYGEAMLNLAFVYQTLKLSSSARSLDQQVLDFQGREPSLAARAQLQLGSLEIEAREWSSAIAHLNRSLALDSSTANPFNDLGYALAMAGRTGEALSVLRRGLARFPEESALLKSVGLAYLRQNDGRLACEWLDRAVAADPGLPSARGLRAEARARSGDSAGALEDWRAYVQLSPDPAERAELEGRLRALGALK